MSIKGITIFIGCVFIIFSLVFVAGQIGANIATEEFKKTAEETIGEIGELKPWGDAYTPVVYFSVDGIEYSGTLSHYDSSMYVGKIIPIYYEPGNPNKFRTDMTGSWRAVVFGGVFSLVGVVMLMILIFGNKKIKRIMKYNTIIEANIIGMNLNPRVTVNDRNPYIIEASVQNPRDFQIYNFQSECFWTNVSHILEQYEIKTIPVYVNPDNYKEYVVDISIFKRYVDKFK